MRHAVLRPVLAAAALIPLLAHAPASATVTGITYGRSWSATSEVAIFRRSTNEMTVRGSLLDLTTGLEVRRNGVAVSDPRATLVSKSGGDDTRIVVRVAGDTDTPLGSCELIIHYAVEANGPDRVALRMWDRGAPTGATVTPAQPKAGETVKVTFTGTGLGSAQFRITEFPGLNRSFQEQGRTDTEYSFSCNPIFPGNYPVNGSYLVDRALPSALRDLEGARYPPVPAGLFVRPNPIASSVSRLVSDVGASLSIGGQNLAGDGAGRFKTLVRYVLYNPAAFDSVPREAVVTSATTGSVVLTVPDNITPGTVRVVLQDQVTATEYGDLVPPFFVTPTRAPQNVVARPFPGASNSRPLLFTADAPAALRTRFFNSRDSIVVESEYTNVPIANLGVKWAGTALTPVLHRYLRRVNITTCAPMASPTPFTGRISISNAGSSTTTLLVPTGLKSSTASAGGTAVSADEFVFVPPPSNAAFQTLEGRVRRGTGVNVSATNGYVAGLGYEIRPRLRIVDSAGAQFTVEAVAVGPNSASFLVPANAATGAIRGAIFEHYGGETVVASPLTIDP